MYSIKIYSIPSGRLMDTISGDNLFHLMEEVRCYAAIAGGIKNVEIEVSIWNHFLIFTGSPTSFKYETNADEYHLAMTFSSNTVYDRGKMYTNPLIVEMLTPPLIYGDETAVCDTLTALQLMRADDTYRKDFWFFIDDTNSFDESIRFDKNHSHWLRFERTSFSTLFDEYKRGNVGLCVYKEVR